MEREDFREIQRLLGPLIRQLSLVASKAVVKLVKDSVGLQGVQATGLSDEVFDDATEHMQPGGLTHVPLAGSEGIYLTIGGVRDDGVLLCISHRAHRPKDLQAGETALYNEGDHQSTIRMLQDGSIVATSGGDTASTITMAANGAITVTSGDGQPINLNGVAIDNDGNVSAPGEVSAMSSSPGTAVQLSTHLHPHPMGPTGSPQPGS